MKQDQKEAGRIRAKRFREKNREKYNEYQREYKRKKFGWKARKET